MGRRRLTREEIELWHRAVEKTDRLNPAGKTPASRPKPKPTKTPTPRQVFNLSPPEPAPAIPPPVGALNMDRKAFGRMKRGKLVPEGRIDLHGMTLDQAHPALVRFVLAAQAAGKRLVLVITGKGKPGDGNGPIPRPRGVLKRQVPHWLEIPPLAQAVLQVTSAHISHGGDGAFYVYLRKSR